MRVAYINPGTDVHGGAERSLIALLDEIRRLDVEPYLLTFGAGSLTDWADDNGIATSSIDVILPGGGRFRGVAGRAWFAAQAALTLSKRVKSIRDHLRQFHPDVIHTNGTRAGVLAPVLRSVPLVMGVRDVAQSPLNRSVLRFSARSAAAVMTNSPFVARAYGFDESHTVAIDNPVPPPTPRDRSEARAKLGIPDSVFVVANLSHLHWMKGHLDLISACQPLAGTVVVIAGGELYDESSRAYHVQLDQAAGRSGNVKLLGAVDDVSWVYAAADAVAHCSVRDEGFGRTIVEGMLAGRPVVASSAGAPGDYLVDGKTALLYEAGDVEGLRRHLTTLRDDTARRQQLVDAALTWAGDRFLPSRHAAAVRNLYDEVSPRHD